MENRVIKFRAWNGQYMLNAEYGDWVSFDGVPYTESEIKYDTPNVEIQKAKNYQLMQFTGLKDKNGNEIYEGDVLNRTHEINGNWIDKLYTTYEVKYLNNIAGFTYVERDHNNVKKIYTTRPFGGDEIEIIGNIFQNPELLK